MDSEFSTYDRLVFNVHLSSSEEICNLLYIRECKISYPRSEGSFNFRTCLWRLEEKMNYFCNWMDSPFLLFRQISYSSFDSKNMQLVTIALFVYILERSFFWSSAVFSWDHKRWRIPTPQETVRQLVFTYLKVLYKQLFIFQFESEIIAYFSI